MPENILQAVLRLLNLVESPVLHCSALDGDPAVVEQLVADGVLNETGGAAEIPRPGRYGPGADLVVRRTAQGLYGVADGDDFCQPVPLEEDDVRQYAVSAAGLVEKLRRENGITGEGFLTDDGLVSVGEKSLDGLGVVDVYLSFPNEHPDVVLGRLKRLENPHGRRVVLLTPGPVPQVTEHRRILADAGIVLVSLLIVAQGDTLVLNWHSALVMQQASTSGAGAAVATKRTVARSVGTQAAVDAVHDYIAAKVLTLTQFGNQFQTTDRTVRRFLKSGKMRRATFEAMAASIGVAPEQLLKGELPASVKRTARR